MICRLEIAMLLVIYLVYGFEDSTVGYILLSFSSWFLAISWLYAPFLFNPAGFEWQKYKRNVCSIIRNCAYLMKHVPKL